MTLEDAIKAFAHAAQAVVQIDRREGGARVSLFRRKAGKMEPVHARDVAAEELGRVRDKAIAAAIRP